MDEIFRNYNTGTYTHRDNLLVHPDKLTLEENLNNYFNDNISSLKERKIHLHSTRDWDMDLAREQINFIEAKLKIIISSYRAFDKRYLCFDEHLIERGCSRSELMNNLSFENPAICTTKQLMNPSFSHVFMTANPFDVCFLSTKSKEAAYGFPLIFNNESNLVLPSLEYDFLEEDLFYYIYGVLNSKIYQKKYQEFLAKNFPRIPFPEAKNIFMEMANKGKRLSDLHLLIANDLDITKFPMGISSDFRIFYVRKNDKDSNGNQIPDTYDPKTQKIYFKKRTKAQIKIEQDRDSLDNITWIGNISQEMWDFEIGGRQQLKEWLYARRYSEIPMKNLIPRQLNQEELDYLFKMCDAIKKTIELLPDLDEIYKKIDP